VSTKLNPGPFDCYAKLAEDEPYFLLRAKDVIAPAVIRYWIDLRRSLASASGTYINQDYEAKLQEAEACATAMETWRKDHP